MSAESMRQAGIEADLESQSTRLIEGIGSARTIGRIGVTLRLGDTSVRCHLNVLPSLPYTIILGLDFLVDQKAAINLNEQTITLNGRMLKFMSRANVPAHYH